MQALEQSCLAEADVVDHLAIITADKLAGIQPLGEVVRLGRAYPLAFVALLG